MREKIIALIEKTLEVPTGTINEGTCIEDISGWDSLAHVLIIGELETQLGLVIPMDKAIELTSVKEIFDTVGV